MTKATEIDKEIGAKIELHRKCRKKKSNWLAKKIDVSPAQVHYYESGENRISASRLYEISKILRFPISKFFPSKK